MRTHFARIPKEFLRQRKKDTEQNGKDETPEDIELYQRQPWRKRAKSRLSTYEWVPSEDYPVFPEESEELVDEECSHNAKGREGGWKGVLRAKTRPSVPRHHHVVILLRKLCSCHLSCSCETCC